MDRSKFLSTQQRLSTRGALTPTPPQTPTKPHRPLKCSRCQKSWKNAFLRGCLRRGGWLFRMEPYGPTFSAPCGNRGGGVRLRRSSDSGKRIFRPDRAQVHSIMSEHGIGALDGLPIC